MYTSLLLVFVNLYCLGLCVCPAGWAQNEDLCYFIFEDKLDKSGSASLCDDHSAQLVTFTNESEWKYISSLMKSVELDSGAWTMLTYGNSGWGWPESTSYTELHHWKNHQDGSNNATMDPNFVPQPDSLQTQAKITIVGSETYLMVELADTQLYPFCVRGVDSRDLCDTNEGWINLLHMCHKYYPPATAADAVSTCSDLGAAVYSPGGPEEFIPADALTSTNTSVWIGATYRYNGYYFEADNRPVMFLPWLSPDSNYSNPNETCMAGLHTNGGLGFYMKSCSEELPFICRKYVGTCPLGWYQDDTSCYRLHIRPEERVTWFMAVDYCKSQNAAIAQRLSAKANGLMYNVLIENDVHLAWLGFSGSNYRYYDVDHKPIGGSYYIFDTTDSSGGPSSCGVTDFARVNCDTGWVAFADQCYKLRMAPMNYVNAVNDCRSLGAKIIHVNTTMQQSFFSTAPFMSYGEEYYWIGVKYDTNSSQYVLQDTDEETQFWNLDPAQPYNKSYAPCIYVSTGVNSPFIGSWFGELCSATHNFVCQMPARPGTPKPSVSQTFWSSQCGAGWNYVNTTNLCYFISPYVHKPWREARVDCQSRHGDLLSIDGEDEQLAVESLLNSDQYNSLEESLWIGAADMADGYGWSWSDNRPFRYLHWGEGEPQYDSDDGDNCGYIPVTKFFEWEARPCGDQLGYICRKSASSVNTGNPPTRTLPLNCQPQPLISGSHSIQFPQGFSASSFKDAQHAPDCSRMIDSNKASWSPSNDSVGEWLAVSFHSPVSITEIEIRGEDSTDKYVSKFKLQFQYDAMSPWYWYTNPDRSVRVFDAVTIPDSSASIYISGELQAHAIKIWPLEWSFGIAIQLELNGCPQNECVPDYAMSGPLFVDDRNIRASSERPGFETWNARLKPARLGQQLSAWMPMDTDLTPWIEVDLGEMKIIIGVTVTGDGQGNSGTLFQLMLSETEREDFITYSEPYGTPYNFPAQAGIGQPVTVYLKSSVEARVVRIVLLKWQGKAALKFDVLVCSAGCTPDPIIASLPSSRLTASDSETYHTPDRSKLNTQRVGDELDGWKPVQPTVVDASYIQADLGTIMQVTAVATQGSQSEDSWVTSYYLAFSTDGQTFRRYGGNVTFYTIANRVTVYNESVTYPGNFDGSTVVKNELAQPVNARYVQLWPHGFHTGIALRWEIYACSKHTASTPLGCYADDASDPDLPYVPLTDKYASIWPEACLYYCYDKGYFYAGLQNGGQCSCGNLYGMYGGAQGCNMSCQQPYTNFTCGGLNQNIVFSTGISPNTLICPPGWTAYKGSCYSLINQDTWSNARDSCIKMGAHLVDISDNGENDLVASIVGDDSWREYETVSIGHNAWIGLSDIRSNLNFEWSSGAAVNFTNWGRHQPTVNPGLGQHSVIISPDRSWTNTLSEDLNSFVCETAMKPSSGPATNTQLIGCPQEWRAGDFNCYRFYRQKVSWSEAQTFCASQNSSLARADSSKENIVLSSTLSELDGSYWIDVHDGNSTGLYTHGAGRVDVAYANWARQKPDSSGKCVSLQTAQHAGEWINEECQNKNRFVCQQPRTGYYPPQVITPIIRHTCASGWEPHGGLCYQFNTGEASSFLTWHEANENCIDQSAALASFHSNTDFDAVVAKFSQPKGNFWIGLNNLDLSTGFQWSDGSVMNFVRWGAGQPMVSQSMSVCGEILLDTQTMGLQFCTERRNWMCSIQQGKDVTNITVDNIPPSENLGACRPLTNIWYKYKDNCYYVSTGDDDSDNSFTWRESRAWCQSRGADLASIKSEEENAFLRGRLNQGIPIEAAWIGLNELDRSSGYSWSDGTPVGTWQMNWNVNEPNDYNGFEGCVEMLARNGKWNGVHCSKRQGFLCKQPAPGVNVTKPVPVTRHDGNCPPNFSRLGYKCYRLLGVNGDLDKQTWTDAHSSCKYLIFSRNRNYSLELASVTTQEENAFITTLLSQHKMSAWLGMRRLSDGQYSWADSEEIAFEGWSKDEPNMAPGNDSCVSINVDANSVGKWDDVSCKEKKAYICQGFVDPAFPKLVVPPSSQCNISDGYQQFGTSCYKVVNQTMSWKEARATCLSSGDCLASVTDGYDWAEMYLLSHTYSDGVWIGLNDLTLQGVYTWDSGYPVTYTRWAFHQPRDSKDGGCICMDSKGLFNNSQCLELKAFVCRRDANPPPEIPTEPGGFCSSQDFILHGSTCYLYVPNAKLTYEMAGRECELRGATLASIHNSSLTFNIPHAQSAWIGLRESVTEGFSWEDSTVLDFTNWIRDFPSWFGDEAIEEGCVAMYGDGGWANVDCENKNGYICAVPANPYETHLSVPPISETSKTPTPLTTFTPVPYSQETPPTPSLYTPTTSSPSASSSSSSSPSASSSSASSQSGTLTSSTSHIPVLPSQQKDSKGLSGGDIAGIVIGVLGAVFCCFVIIFSMYHRGFMRSSFLRREASRVKNFENSLYAETRKDTLTKSNNIEGINIVALESDYRELSVSYSVVHSFDEFNSTDLQQLEEMRFGQDH